MIDKDFITNTKIVGVTKFNEKKRPIQMLLPDLNPGERLLFIRDYGNEYDENAIKIYSRNGEHIGYISRELAKEIAPFLDKNMNYDLEGLVLQVTGSENESYGCNIRIWLESSEERNDSFQEPVQKSQQKTDSIGEIKAQGLCYGIILLLVAIFCWFVLSKIWWFFYVIAIGIGLLGAYFFHLVFKI